MYASFHCRVRNHPWATLVFSLLWTAASLGIFGALLKMQFNPHHFFWTKVACTIDRIDIKADVSRRHAFRPDLVYRYEWAGVHYQGTRLWQTKESDRRYETLFSAFETIREKAGVPSLEGASSECLVDPTDPSQSALLRDPGPVGGSLLLLLFGTGFSATGIMLVRMSIRILSEGRSEPTPADTRPLLWVACSFFGLTGLVVFVGLSLGSLLQSWSSRKWVEVPAQVIWSRIIQGDRRSGKRSRATHVDIYYRYHFEGREYRSNSFSAFGQLGNKRDLVAAHPAGSTFTCVVDPERPWKALGDRKIGLGSGIALLFPLPFMAIGWFGLRWLWRTRPKGKRPRVMEIC